MYLNRVLCSCSAGLLKSAATTIVGFKSNLFDDLSSKLPLQRYTRKHFTHDYCILVLQRPQTFPTFGGRIVFPGGLLMDSDSSRKIWSNLKSDRFLKTTTVPDTYRKVCKSSGCCRTMQSLDSAISFRLCAIRELFEETGLLLSDNYDDPDRISAHAILLDNNELKIWQDRVAKDQCAFSELYSHLRSSPPITALHEWSSWKSPPTLKHRFDTMFYFVEIKSVIIHAQQHEDSQRWKSSEAEVLYADSPPAFLQSQIQHNSPLFKSVAPPQAYELCRLVHFEKLDQLREFSYERSRLGSRSWCPLPARGKINSQTHLLFFLPGDQRYDQLLKFWKQMKFAPEFDPTWYSDAHRNRFMFGAGSLDSWFDCTVNELGHVLPMSFSEFSSKYM